MGVKRGSFESVSLSSQVERAVEHSTIRPDEGAPLRIGAKALDSWSDAFGKMAKLASKVKAKQGANAGIQGSCETAMDRAASRLREYEAMDPSLQNNEEHSKLQQAFEQASARYRASKTLGVFSGDFDMDRDWVALEQKQKQAKKQ